jgi:hypothetical protein
MMITLFPSPEIYRSSGSTFLENSNIGFPVVVCRKRFSLRRTISNL